MILLDRPHAAGVHSGVGRVRVPARLLGVVVAAGLLIVGCAGSTDLAKNPTPAPSADTTTSSPLPTGSTGAPARPSSPDTTPSAPAPTTTAFTSVAETTTRTSASTPSTPKPSGTAAIGTLDADSIRWFTAMCTGLSSADTSTAHRVTGSVGQRRAGAAKVFTDAAQAYRAMGKALSGLGAPAIPGGARLHNALLAAAPQMAAAAERGAATVRAATDDPSITAAIQAADDSVNTAKEPLSGFAEAIAAPALAVQLERIDACRPLFT